MRDDEPYLWESNLCLNKEHLRITWRCVKRDVKETKFLSLSLSLSLSLGGKRALLWAHRTLRMKTRREVSKTGNPALKARSFYRALRCDVKTIYESLIHLSIRSTSCRKIRRLSMANFSTFPFHSSQALKSPRDISRETVSLTRNHWDHARENAGLLPLY